MKPPPLYIWAIRERIKERCIQKVAVIEAASKRVRIIERWIQKVVVHEAATSATTASSTASARLWADASPIIAASAGPIIVPIESVANPVAAPRSSPEQS